MDAKKSFKAFLSELKSAFPSEEFGEVDIAEYETMITPKVLQILQKDRKLFEEPFEVFDVDIAPLVRANPDRFWKHIQSSSFAAFLSGDIKGKVGKLLDNFKHLWGGSTTEIDKILGSEESRSKVSEILEFVMSTKLAKIVSSLVETIDIASLGIDFDNPEDALKSIQEPSNKIMETVMRKIKDELDSRLRRGEFSKEQLVQDIERIKVKVQEAFGDVFNDMLGGRKADVPATALLSNTPEARRARMMARLRRKVSERKSGDINKDA
jgi:hypothetical protein